MLQVEMGERGRKGPGWDSGDVASRGSLVAGSLKWLFSKQDKTKNRVSVGEDVLKSESLCSAGGSVKRCSPVGHSLVVPHKVKLNYNMDPAIPLRGIYPKELKSGTQNRYLRTNVHYSQQSKGGNNQLIVQ